MERERGSLVLAVATSEPSRGKSGGWVTGLKTSDDERGSGAFPCLLLLLPPPFPLSNAALFPSPPSRLQPVRRSAHSKPQGPGRAWRVCLMQGSHWAPKDTLHR
ncbi:hypothetical protein LX36DRAFT_111594 [Colletotrichum falcatum]|nr:hypothetical protein LX36DRAFT_111594 [Colletotrichum falcatum]